MHVNFMSRPVGLQEAAACRTIAARGVLVVAAAHGSSLSELLTNPELRDLVGGVKAVSIGDQLARSSNVGHKVCPSNNHSTSAAKAGCGLDCRPLSLTCEICLHVTACRVLLIASSPSRKGSPGAVRALTVALC